MLHLAQPDRRPGRLLARFASPERPEPPICIRARVAVIVPARNEADVIGQAIRSLLEQVYAAPLRIFVGDDHSSDETASVICKAATNQGERLTMISSAPLPEGWTGKMWG